VTFAYRVPSAHGEGATVACLATMTVITIPLGSRPATNLDSESPARVHLQSKSHLNEGEDMLAGVVATLFAVVLNTMGAVMAARDSHGQRAPAPSPRARRCHGSAWVASVVAALAIGSALWNSAPVVSIGVVVAVLVLANGLPVIDSRVDG